MIPICFIYVGYFLNLFFFLPNHCLFWLNFPLLQLLSIFFFSWHSKTYLTIENLQQQSTNNNIIYYLFQKLLVCPTKYEREQFPCNEGVHSNTIQIISGNNNFTIKCNCSLGACMGSVITMEIVLYNSFIKNNNNNKKHLLSSWGLEFCSVLFFLENMP